MNGSTNLIPQPSQWVNLPTKAVRLPEVFIPQIVIGFGQSYGQGARSAKVVASRNESAIALGGKGL